METIQELLSQIDSKGKLEEALSVLLNFENVASVSFAEGKIRKSVYYKDGDNKKVSKWHDLSAFNYTEEEISDFFDKASDLFPKKKTASTIYFDIGAGHLEPINNSIFFWKKHN